jgi:hypothetical protein
MRVCGGQESHKPPTTHECVDTYVHTHTHTQTHTCTHTHTHIHTFIHAHTHTHIHAPFVSQVIHVARGNLALVDCADEWHELPPRKYHDVCGLEGLLLHLGVVCEYVCVCVCV